MSFLPLPFRHIRRGHSIPTSLDDFFDLVNEGGTISSPTTNFKVDVKESPAEYIIKADLPGVNKNGISVSLAQQLLTITVDHEEEKEEKEENYLMKERRYFSSQRSIPLALAGSQDDVLAEFKNGVLEIRIKKTPQSQTRKISIK